MATGRFELPPADLMSRWARWYPSTPPVGFLLRDACPDRCVRIHSLPRSKRYPMTEGDREILLARHNRVAGDVLGAGTECAVILYESVRSRSIRGLRQRAGLGAGRIPCVGALAPELSDEEDGFFVGQVSLFALSLTWRPGNLDPFILAVAEDEVAGLVVSLRDGCVYAPYDGGADLIVRDRAARRAALRDYARWLPSANRAG